VEIPSWKGLSGPQLAAVPGLFGWESLDGRDFLGHNLLLSQASFGENPLMDGIFWATTCCCLRPLSSRWNSGYHEAFSRTFFFFHDGIVAITKPFSRTFFFFHDGILAITKPFSRTFSFFHDGILAITKPFSRTFSFFHDGILEIRNLGEDSFHIYITKSIYIGSAWLKTLPLDLEPPLQGKEYGPSYSNATRKSKTNFLYRNHL
jgi:hypothetical protein